MCCTTLTGWALTNYGLVLFAAAMLLTIVQWSSYHKLPTYEILYRWTTLLPLGLMGILGFIVHIFYSDIAAATIGWPNSPFQSEVAVADLSFGILAVLSYDSSYHFRVATVVGTVIWLWGNAAGHAFQIIHHHNLNPGNAGSWFWLDIIIPFILIGCIMKLKPRYGAF
jgi:hypothetical protein